MEQVVADGYQTLVNIGYDPTSWYALFTHSVQTAAQWQPILSNVPARIITSTQIGIWTICITTGAASTQVRHTQFATN